MIIYGYPEKTGTFNITITVSFGEDGEYSDSKTYKFVITDDGNVPELFVDSVSSNTYCVSTSNTLTYFDDKNWYYYIRAKKKSDGTSISSTDATSLTFFNSNISLSWITTGQPQPFVSGLQITGRKPSSNQYDESCSTDIYAEYVNSMNGKTYRTPTKRYYLYGYNACPIYRYNSVINMDATALMYKGGSFAVDISDYFGKFSTSNTDWWPMGVAIKQSSSPSAVTIGTTSDKLAKITYTNATTSSYLTPSVEISKTNNRLKIIFNIIQTKASTSTKEVTTKPIYVAIRNNFGSCYIRIQLYRAKKTDYTANAGGKYSSTTPIITLPTPLF